jgi:hypothetical protein
MKIPNSPGVYCLKAINSKLIYVGSTKNLRVRRNLHTSTIRKKDKQRGVVAMIEAFEKEDLIEFSILEQCSNYSEREQHWIDVFKQEGTFVVINQFDAERKNSSIEDSFRQRMSNIRKEAWKDFDYRRKVLSKTSATVFTSERLNKEVHCLDGQGNYLATYKSAKEASQILSLNSISLASASRGDFKGRFKYKGYIFIYSEVVLYKLDELLETHQDIRAISSQAWETIKSTMKVQRLIGEQS